jgi:SPP1 family predicted phage head-tail adaptor
MDAGKRDRLVTFERSTPTVDVYGDEIHAWTEYAKAWAAVEVGTGKERREAAQEAASAPATFKVLWTPTLAALTTKDRISAGGVIWDIKSVAPVGLNIELHITAVRSA